MIWKDINMLLCRDHFCPSLAPQGCHFKWLSCFGNLYFFCFKETIQGKVDTGYCTSLCMLQLCLLSHSLWCKYPSIYVWFLLSSPICSSSCYAADGSHPKSSSFSSSKLLFFFASSFTSYFIVGQQNVCHIRSHAEALLLLLLPFSLIRLLSNWATQWLHKS